LQNFVQSETVWQAIQGSKLSLPNLVGGVNFAKFRSVRDCMATLQANKLSLPSIVGGVNLENFLDFDTVWQAYKEASSACQTLSQE
jgi:hypothetical protein